VVLTPLLVVLLMNTSGAPRVDGAAVRDIVLQLLLPFAAGQLTRPWIAAMTTRYAALLKVVDRGSILLVVYTAFSMGVVQGIWVSVPLMIFHQIQLIVCAVIASRLAREADENTAAPTEVGEQP